MVFFRKLFTQGGGKTGPGKSDRAKQAPSKPHSPPEAPALKSAPEKMLLAQDPAMPEKRNKRKNRWLPTSFSKKRPRKTKPYRWQKDASNRCGEKCEQPPRCGRMFCRQIAPVESKPGRFHSRQGPLQRGKISTMTPSSTQVGRACA